MHGQNHIKITIKYATTTTTTITTTTAAAAADDDVSVIYRIDTHNAKQFSHKS